MHRMYACHKYCTHKICMMVVTYITIVKDYMYVCSEVTDRLFSAKYCQNV